MNLQARHDKRRVQRVKGRCYCPVHKGSPRRGKVTHAMRWDTEGAQLTAEVRNLGTSIVTGPWYGDDGQVVDASIETAPFRAEDAFLWSSATKRVRLTKRLRAIRAEVQRENRLCRQAAANPNYPPRGWHAQVAEWHAQGVAVTDEGPVFTARMEPMR